MTLLESSQQLKSQILERDRLLLANRNAEMLRTRTQEMQSLRQAIQAETGRFVTLRDSGVSAMKTPDPSTALSSVKQVLEIAATNPFDTGKEFGNVKRSAEKVRKDLSVACERALDALSRDLPNIDEGFLKQVEAIPTYADRVARIRQRRDELLKGQDPRYMGASDLKLFLEKRDALRRLADQLDPEEFPKEVLDFFKATRMGGGAPLEKWTSTVQEWMKERDQLKNVRIVVLQR